ncbi:hypothetical protein VSH64_37625 [Amycolatopsis rhabdoformis]|uniref:N-acetyltransferase domain-containing protein n=1 Tax=Amycolatopsis rhabdoformis TaxID=1448059 RepID=A0ABZ1I2W5_9PSEU|nr:hypothetical protein [Amycolatopsis rhabdoformis]WSE28509.1 hypothetical protein VSH64_37625 [Amycolatopsis rhabdoformis]
MIDLPPLAIEDSEAESVYRLETGAPEAAREALGITATRLGGGVVLSVRNDPTHFWSKALGFGRTEPVTAELIAEVCAFYRAAGTRRATLALAPSVLPEDWADICAREGLTTSTSWAKLVAPVADVVARADDPARKQVNGIRIAPVEPRDAHRWASRMLGVFGMPEEHLVDVFVAATADPACYPYAGWLGDDLVGTGLLYRMGDIGQLFSGAVAEHARNRGGQTEFIAVRARLAAELGCRWLVAETGAETDGEHNSSLHNLLNLGFEVAYERPNWTWRAAD